MVTDDETPMLLKKKEQPKKNPLWDFSDIPSSIHPSQYLKKEQPSVVRSLSYQGIRPYVKFRDLNNPEGDNDSRTPHPAVEIGIRGSF